MTINPHLETIDARSSRCPNVYPVGPKGSHDEIPRSEFDSIAVVVAACQHGDSRAHRQLYDLFHQSVYRITARMVGLQDGADVAHQVFLQVFRSIGQFNGRS